MLKLLLENGVDVNDSSGSTSPDNTTRKFTALHIAAYLGYEDVAGILLSKGADKEAICLSGKRPVDVAVEKSHQDVASPLRIMHLSQVLYIRGCNPLSSIGNYLFETIFGGFEWLYYCFVRFSQNFPLAVHALLLEVLKSAPKS